MRSSHINIEGTQMMLRYEARQPLDDGTFDGRNPDQTVKNFRNSPLRWERRLRRGDGTVFDLSLWGRDLVSVGWP